MKGPLDRTKVVLRQLPPAITEAMLMEQIDTAFAGRYNWVSFRPGKTSQKHQSCSRAYIDFKRPEDVIDFASFFNGHVFVNEKGSQYKTLVEYAPSQRVPKQWSKKDGREGSIHKDPEYLEFLDSIAKPVENLPSAEIQLERREAERAGAPKEAPIVTPLMDFVRQKRAAKAGPRRILSNGKLSRRAGGSSGGNAGSASSKRVSEKKRTATTMYVLRESPKSTAGKDKSTYVLVPKRDDQKIFNKSATSGSASGSEILEEESVSGTSGNPDSGKKKILLLKGRSQEVSNMSDNSMSQPQSVASSARITISSPALKQNQRGSGRIIRGILLNKETRQNQASVHQAEQQLHNLNLDKDRRPPRPPNFQSDSKDANGVPDEKAVNDLHGFREKQERRTRNKDRPDRGVWTLRRSDGSYASDESFSSSGSQPSLSVGDSSEGVLGDVKIDMSSMRSGEIRTVGSGRSSHPSFDNGSHRHGRRGMTHGVKDADGSYDGKPLRRGAASGHGSHEKQVWVQKASSGS